MNQEEEEEVVVGVAAAAAMVGMREEEGAGAVVLEVEEVGGGPTPTWARKHRFPRQYSELPQPPSSRSSTRPLETLRHGPRCSASPRCLGVVLGAMLVPLVSP